jgi:hypothetical protein
LTFALSTRSPPLLNKKYGAFPRDERTKCREARELMVGESKEKLQVCFLEDLPLDIVRAAPVVLDHLAWLRSSAPSEFEICARKCQTNISVFNCIMDVGILNRHVSVIRRCALHFGVGAATNRMIEGQTRRAKP